MLELVRGYAAAALDAVDRDEGRSIAQVGSDLSAVAELLLHAEPLRLALTDPGVPATGRQAILEDLLTGRILPETVRLLTFVASSERAGELPRTTEHLIDVTEGAEDATASGDGHRGDSAEPPVGRGGALERIRGYAEYEFESVPEREKIDEIEDELFRFGRILESTKELHDALADQELPVPVRLRVVRDLLGGKVAEETLRLVCYSLRAGRLRDLAGTVGFLVELAAAERGRRVAHVRSAVELSETERDRLSAALGRIARRPVELRVRVDPSVLGGLEVVLGDTVIDGTVRHRLEQLRESLLQRS